MKKKSLEEIRAALRNKDLEIVSLLNERAKLALEVGKIKNEKGQAVYDPARERLVYRYLSQINPGPFSNKAVRDIFREIISASRDLQRPITVAYFGPEASFTHLAALSHFGQRARFSPQKNMPWSLNRWKGSAPPTVSSPLRIPAKGRSNRPSTG